MKLSEAEVIRGHDLGDVLCSIVEKSGDASRHGLAGPEGPEPHSRLGAARGIPIAEKHK